MFLNGGPEIDAEINQFRFGRLAQDPLAELFDPILCPIRHQRRVYQVPPCSKYRIRPREKLQEIAEAGPYPGSMQPAQIHDKLAGTGSHHRSEAKRAKCPGITKLCPLAEVMSKVTAEPSVRD